MLVREYLDEVRAKSAREFETKREVCREKQKVFNTNVMEDPIDLAINAAEEVKFAYADLVEALINVRKTYRDTKFVVEMLGEFINADLPEQEEEELLDLSEREQ